MEELISTLRRIDGKGYPAYKDLRGRYRLPLCDLVADWIQGDPFAAPSRFRLILPWRETGLPEAMLANPIRAIALGDYLTRQIDRAIKRVVKGRRGSGGSGRVEIDRPGQEILERSSVLVGPEAIEARITVGLPAAGRRILAREAQQMLTDELPAVVKTSLLADSLDIQAVWHHLTVAEDQEMLRGRLAELGLVSFLGEGSILPRASGVDERPMRQGVVPLEVPEELATEVTLASGRRVRGLAIREGVTLIVGGGYHGKSTLLDGMIRGIYNHIPGDGRELVVTRPQATFVRAEDGRYVAGVDISSFISHLPGDKDTRFFSTDDASGSTSQAAAIAEALEAGADGLLLDEDTSATNFLIRDSRMQRLVSKEHEPITPFIDRVRGLHRDQGVSTVLVLGGSGDYLDVADRVIMMDHFRPRDVTGKAREICAQLPSTRIAEEMTEMEPPRDRIPLTHSVDPSKGHRAEKVRSRATRAIQFGDQEIDISLVRQIVDDSQARTIGDALLHLKRHLLDGQRPLRELMNMLSQELQGLTLLAGTSGDRAMVRTIEIAAALNRLRTLLVKPQI